ncbi:hypothetical protein DL98DRAFT_578738 [Cadophora sp. DSE1049]|nr:hypothetical protein DL98DRAFT_578738 [Cadophora sp. DSE1049]
MGIIPACAITAGAIVVFLLLHPWIIRSVEYISVLVSTCARPLQDFEEKSAQEGSYAEDAILAQGTPSSDSGQYQWLDTANKEVVELPPVLQVERRDGPEENKTLLLQRLPASRSERPTNGCLRPSDKKDLIPAQVEVVAGLLISKDSISFFLDNCRLIYEGWLSFSAQPLAYRNNVEQSLIAGLDIVQGLVKGNHIRRLLLRFAYMNLARTIVDCKTVAATDRSQGNTYRSVGRRDATVAIDMYLKAKQDVSGETLKRSTLLGYCRAGRRWADLAGSSPLLVFILPQMAETMVQNNSITDSTVKDIAHRIQSHHPDLTKALVNVGQCAGLAPSNTVPVASIEDVVLRTTQELSPILDRM